MLDNLFNSYPVLPYIIIILLICLSAFFSGSEIAFAGVNKRRLKKKADEGSKKCALALKMNENYDRILPAILIGNNLVNIGASSIATVIALKLFINNSGLGTTVATAIMTVLILIFGEIIPKLTANEANEKFAEKAAYPLRFFTVIFKPVVFLVSLIVKIISKIWDSGEEQKGLTEDELLTIIETVEDEGVIDEDKKELLQSAIEFDEITVREILTPRVDMVVLDIDDGIDENINRLLECDFSRIPVYEDTIDNIIGVIYLNEFLKSFCDKKPDDLRPFLHEPTFFHQSMKLDNVLEEFKLKQCHMAIITDEYGGTMGLLTLEDVVEEIVGDIWDEKDTIKNESYEIKDNMFVVNGDMALFDFCDQFDISEDSIECDCVTVGGLAIEMLNGYPKTGDKFKVKNILLTVTKAEDFRVKELFATVLEEKGEKDTDEV